LDNLPDASLVTSSQIKVERGNEIGSLEVCELGEVQTDRCLTAADVGLKLSAAKEIMGRLQEIVIQQQLRQHCEAARQSPA